MSFKIEDKDRNMIDQEITWREDNTGIIIKTKIEEESIIEEIHS